MEFMDIFNSDAFSLVSMTAAINNVDNIPGRAGELVFAGVGTGVSTTTVAIEKKSEALSLIQTSARGAPAPQQTQDKASLFNVTIPQIKKEETIGAFQIQGVREFGSTNVAKSASAVVQQQILKTSREIDLTLEYHRLGALKGFIRDADGTLLQNLYDLFGVAEPDDFNFALATTTTDVRGVCSAIARFMRRNAKTSVVGGRIHAFCGDAFFDALINHAKVQAAYQNYQAAEDRLGNSYVNRVFTFGGIDFENYAGTDDGAATDGGTVGIHSHEARFFLTGVPGLYAEYYAPADFMDTVNTIGLPRYAKIAPDQDMNRWVKLHAQTSPLPLCLRPRTLVRGVANAADTSDFPASAT